MVVAKEINTNALVLISLKDITVGSMEHDGFQTVASAMSQGNGPQVSECGAINLGQPKRKRRDLKHAMPTDAIPTGAKANKGKKALKVKVSLASRAEKVKKPRKNKYTQIKSTPNVRKERKCTLLRDSRGRFLPKESNGENTQEITTVMEIDYGRVINPRAPDCATILSILKGKKGIRQCNKIRRLKDPDFVSLMNAMNNTDHVAKDDGHYDVLKVLMQADGWSE
ncbi:uncharacterized protein LOC102704106 isoform X1 [Oryza brachyantha]|uniref:uncharacterized protein LOC102704106 isoform X1 n=1 Tax=Oryza brachyantha TaxID=4533 RepID=UPI0003EAC893|nr:uncharacterized protein LOC102704106 isoform X1 [Oryza brachyantha]XP_015698183.1 uncharacterized protein LOC102704106 isoform X1 [Oryza brachyantha]